MSLKLHSAFQAPSKRELAQTESPVDFPCKLGSERLKRERQPSFGTFAGNLVLINLCLPYIQR
jgi:hypothetical protein